jgi:hypothetical protein
MIYNVVTTYLPVVVFMTVVGLLNYLISKRLSKRRLVLIWVLPLIFLIPGAVFILLGLTSEGWSIFGYMFYGFLLMAAAIGSGLSSLIIYLKQR